MRRAILIGFHALMGLHYAAILAAHSLGAVAARNALLLSAAIVLTTLTLTLAILAHRSRRPRRDGRFPPRIAHPEDHLGGVTFAFHHPHGEFVG